MADGAPFIPRGRPARAAQDFERLRETAMERVRTLAAGTWTDHNHHDPGITVMEAFCYAMTELGLKLDLDMADLLASGASRAAAALLPASAVLPNAPVTTEDLRRQLLDNYLLRDARIDTGVSDSLAYYALPGQVPPFGYAPPALGSGERITPSGLYDVMLSFRNPVLNSNTYAFQVQVAGNPIGFEIALPNWDEPEAEPFLAGSAVLNAVAMLDPASPWRKLEDSVSYYGRAKVAFTRPTGPGAIETWAVLRLTSGPELQALALPPILAAARTVVESLAAGGLFRLFLQRVAQAAAAARAVEHDLATRRNLTEAQVTIAVSRVQEIAVNARIEVAATTGLEEMLADILFAIDEGLSPPLRFEEAAQQRAAGRTSSDIFDGPLLLHGVLADPPGEPLVRDGRIFLSDILNLVMRRGLASAENAGPDNPLGRDIVAVTELSLSNFINNSVVTSGAKACLQLIDVARHKPRLSVPKCRIQFVRDDVEVEFDLTRVAVLFEARVAEAEATARLAEHDPEPAAPRGVAADVGDYYPFQYDLPAIYGVTEAGLPASAGTARRQAARQLRAYLTLMEQVLADASEQLASVNRLFSPSADEQRSYFTSDALLQIEDMEAIVRHDAGQPWDGFIADPENSYAGALAGVTDEPDIALGRRNRMLDHLLARHGEDMTAWGQELHRWAQKALLAADVPPATLPARIAERRRATNAALLRGKSEYLAELPRLHALRLMAYGDPSQWDPGLITVSGDAGQYSWSMMQDSVPVLEGPAAYPTRGEAVTRAREALRLTGRAGFWGAQDFGGGPGNRRYVLRSGQDAADPVIARSPIGFNSLAAANTAASALRQRFADRILRDSRTAMERRIDHQIGLTSRARRRLAGPLTDRFEIVDAAALPPFAKIWQLRANSGPAGQVLLSAAVPFVDPVEATAVANAQQGIEQALAVALDPWNWHVEEPVTGSFVGVLSDTGGQPLAQTGSFGTRAAAEAAQAELVSLIYDHYGGEGYHMVETLLLRPRTNTDPFVQVPDGDGGVLSDPYSHRIVFVLPSGYARDFGLVDAPRIPARPHRFRDPEFRAHALRMIRQSCPAHIVPEIRWVDRRAPGSIAAQESFEVFEQRHFAWLVTELLPGASVQSATNARAALIASLNALLRG
ncbi:hypothetical protein [Marimonas arenosa]|uniref:Uncharacterized protein n=1 Tax=Marimonas arenosa TaxID=1795305 RepID=A0AAE3W9R3_9RHOB|nr:hypothetical protein [Marimonas arenosa]MDQ2088737.1 hypothetical protein [Marimonas arenosa]